jgi:hypothetical protein
VRLDTEDPGCAAGGGLKALEHLQSGGLAGPVRSEDRDELAFGDLEGHAVDGPKVPEVFRELVDDDGTHAASRSPVI